MTQGHVEAERGEESEGVVGPEGVGGATRPRTTSGGEDVTGTVGAPFG